MLRTEDNHPELPKYPDLIQVAQNYNLILRILVLLSLTIASVCLTINIFTFRTYWWSLIVIANLAYMWVATGTALRPSVKLGQTVMMQAIYLSVLVVVLGYLLDFHSLVYNYVLPAVLVCATLSITIIVILKRMDIHSFVLYFILIALLGFIPVAIMAVGFVTVPWPSVVSALYSGLSLISIFLFANHATKIELKKRFHL